VSARIDHVVTSGSFSLDGGTWDVDNNVWLLGDDHECVVFDAPHDVEAILAAVGDRRLVTIVCTHAHDDHVRVAPELAERTGAPVLLHPDDLPVWRLTHPDVEPDGALADGQRLEVARTFVEVLHTPGHSPGACCFYAPQLGTLFSGDTLFAGGPGATGRSFSDFPTIIDSVRRLFDELPADTIVNTGHGDSTTLGAEAPHLQEWVDRGH
jgi:glyoxylase-like metal-dependent hydrolase (beta-lactamase superfamily II)